MRSMQQVQSVLLWKNARYVYSFLFVLLLIAQAQATYANQSPIIPKPQHIKPVNEHFILSERTPIIANSEVARSIYFLQKEVLRYTGISLQVHATAAQPSIQLSLVTRKNLKDKKYRMLMGAKRIQIIAADDEGLFMGITSLMQIIRQTAIKDETISLSCWEIEDKPYYAWRGLMLDESRHFFGKEKVKSLLDWMAFYKLNKFHWHLTDQTGWRIEIKKYPKLTLIGGIGNYSNPYTLSKYYTQEDIKEIVAYGLERHIEIIPEIDMPGHATAANMAYPEFSGGGSERYPEFTFNPGKEEVYQYLTNILKEVDVLFPSQIIHLGADEVHFGNENWNTDPAVQKLMRDKGLKTLKDVEYYFIHRMADSVMNLNNEVMAWDEVVGSDLSPTKTTVMWWRHDRPEELTKALDKGFSTILCPRLPLYFDFVQDSTHSIGRKWKKGYSPIEDVYNFPTQEILNHPKAQELIRGIQANLWTEALSTDEHIDFMLFPRITALAESAWAEPSSKDYANFNKRLKSHLLLFSKAGLYHYDPFEPAKFPEYISPVQRNNMSPDFDELMKQELQQ